MNRFECQKWNLQESEQDRSARYAPSYASWLLCKFQPQALEHKTKSANGGFLALEVCAWPLAGDLLSTNCKLKLELVDWRLKSATLQRLKSIPGMDRRALVLDGTAMAERPAVEAGSGERW